MSFGDTEENTILDTLLEMNNWVGYSTADPGDDGATLAEPVGNGYARVAVTTATWSAAAAGSKTNSAVITFPEATGDQGTATWACIFAASTGGVPRVSIQLTAPVAVTSGKIPRFSAGKLVVTLT